MAIEIRKCEVDELHELGEVWSVTYNNGEPFTRDDSKPRLSEDFVAFVDDEVAGGFGVSPMTATRGQAEFQCAGVLAVAVMPHLRKTGVGGKMMRFALREYYDRGYELASLYGFRETYYRRFGYEAVGDRYRISVEVPFFPKVEAKLPVRQFGADSVDIIRDCYLEFSHKRSGLNLRHENQWDRVLPKDGHRTVYVAGDPVEAYLVIQHKVDFWDDQEIVEFVWNSREGYDTILSVMAGIAANKAKLTWVEPSDSPFRALYWEHGAYVTGLTPQIMYRVLNVKKAFEGLKPRASGTFSIEIVDEEFPENVGPWQVTFSPEGVSVEAAQAAGLKIDIRQFTQAFLGEPSLATLALNELFEIRSKEDLRQAELLLTPSPTLCFESF